LSYRAINQAFRLAPVKYGASMPIAIMEFHFGKENALICGVFKERVYYP